MVDKNKLIKALKKMEVRTTFICRHQKETQDIYNAWQEAIKTADWSEVSNKILQVIKFIEDNKRMFPNCRAHLETWNFLEELTKELNNES